MFVYDIYANIRLWFQPYWRPAPPRVKPEPTPKKSRDAKTAPSTPVTEDNSTPGSTEETTPEVTVEESSPSDSGSHDATEDTGIEKMHGHEAEVEDLPHVARGETMEPRGWCEAKGLYIHNLKHPLGDIWRSEKLPAPQQSWYYHDATTHELFTHLIPGSAFKFTGRNERARNLLKPLIKPINLDGPYDRTHLIPFGYHGVESDPRLLIGWDSEQNRGPMNQFEQRQKARTTPIYWLVRVLKTKNGARLLYGVWDARTMEHLDIAEYVMNDTQFFWVP